MIKSKENLDQRQNQLQARLDRKWQPQRATPVLESGKVHYEVSGRVEAICWGGLGLMQTLVKKLGLAEAIDEDLHLLKSHRPYHESDHVLSLVYNVISGGHCLEDLKARRRDIGYLNALGAKRIPDATTSGDFLRRFTAPTVKILMDTINRIRANVWQCQPKKDRRLALIDVDGTIVGTEGCKKEKMDYCYKKEWGFGPLVVSLANSQEVLYMVNRPANRPSHDGCVPWLDKAASWSLDQAGFEKVRFRGDTDFSLTENFDRWTDSGYEFVFGIDAHPSFVNRARALPSEAWSLLERDSKSPQGKRRLAPDVKKKVVEERAYRNLTVDREDIAEIDYQPQKCKKPCRMIILRKKIRVTQGQLSLEDEIRYFFYVTNVPEESLDKFAVVRESNVRCNQENLIAQLKNGVEATHLPVREFDGNWAYLVIASLAWNLKAWCGLVLPSDLDARKIIRMEYRRFRNEIINLPAQILRTSRRLVFRLLGVNRWARMLLEGVSRLKDWKLA